MVVSWSWPSGLHSETVVTALVTGHAQLVGSHPGAAVFTGLRTGWWRVEKGGGDLCCSPLILLTGGVGGDPERHLALSEVQTRRRESGRRLGEVASPGRSPGSRTCQASVPAQACIRRMGCGRISEARAAFP